MELPSEEQETEGLEKSSRKNSEGRRSQWAFSSGGVGQVGLGEHGKVMGERECSPTLTGPARLGWLPQ